MLVARKVSAERGKGGMKTVIGFAPCENGGDVDAFVEKHIATGAVVTSDEHRAYAMLVTHYNLKRVNHSERYSGADGENINQAESYFSRFRRMQVGQNHFFGKHLLAYAAESAWRDDNRRNSNAVNARALLGLLLKPNVDSLWRGFWKVYLRKGKGVTLPAGISGSALAVAA
ncbi:MAG: transposase [Humidesulfovibrio sp.]|uniref:transposase n=1 Tax=Humidesulfovibrio sp. TaxID=2910988 RepID=UPI002734577A|nr:transposase [Humidesulfovibrio sp.]MDP2846794.1 transposase [Humidesulfovibrio sp.]